MVPLGCRVVIVAAHPDDEVLGLGVHLAGFQDLAAIVHVTDGAPRGGDDVRNAGCASWQDYATLRRMEFAAAMAAAGVHTQSICLNCPDQQASFQIATIAKSFVSIFSELTPEVIFTHPYEGGHPDHDATVAAVHAANRLGGGGIEIYEYACYHNSPHGMIAESFLPNGAEALEEYWLSDEERRRKRGVLAKYASQQKVLEQFPLQCEPIRRAPVYDFTQPPHAGILHYEHFEWGVNGQQWRDLAAEAFRELGIQRVSKSLRFGTGIAPHSRL